MQERRQIVKLWREGGEFVLATLVHVEGSSYRRTGARLLMAADGRYAGAISGGCLEADLMRRARWAVREGAVVQRYSTLFDDTAEIPFGLGCGGVVDVLLEPGDTAEFGLLMRAMERSLGGQAQLVRTTLPTDGRPLERDVADSQDAAEEQSRSGMVVEALLPPARLVVLGAGDDAQPLVSMAAMLGWEIDVADGRRQWARAERFPAASHVAVMEAGTEGVLRAGDAAVVMTHSYEQDREWLLAALRADTRYLGLLGSRHRSALLMSEAAAMLGWPVERVCERVFAPVGLDLGGDGAEAIALAVVAEVQAVLQGKLGKLQRMTAADVAAQVEKGGASLYLQTQCAL